MAEDGQSKRSPLIRWSTISYAKDHTVIASR